MSVQVYVSGNDPTSHQKWRLMSLNWKPFNCYWHIKGKINIKGDVEKYVHLLLVDLKKICVVFMELLVFLSEITA